MQTTASDRTVQYSIQLTALQCDSVYDTMRHGLM